MNLSRSTGNDIVSLKAIDRKRAHEPAFSSKILSDSEQTLYRSSITFHMPFENFLWLLWSVKESVYKYCKRNSPDMGFSPPKIVIQQIALSNPGPFSLPSANPLSANPLSPNSLSADPLSPGPLAPDLCGDVAYYSGTAVFGSDVFYFKSVIHPEFISTVANGTQCFEDIRCGIKRMGDPVRSDRALSERQSAEARKFLLQEWSRVFPADSAEPSVDCLRIEKTPAGYPVIKKGDKVIESPVSLAHHGHFVAYSFLMPPVRIRFRNPERIPVTQ